MANNRRSSDNVVIPDITEVTQADPLASEHEPGRNDGGSALATSNSVKGGRLSSDSNGVVTVPVSLPVGTLITGTTFNVITSDQLPHHFKPMICVDNGFISGGPVNDDIKATHIVIQNPPTPPSRSHSHEDNVTPPSSSRSSSSFSWSETAHMPILPIRCKNTSAELHKHRFGSGGRGRCIKYGMEWYTPSEFEALCGRASSKDWKRSIRFGGRSIQALIDEGVLTPHATSCTCGACCEDHSAMGPVRLFTPYKRKKRTLEMDDKKTKIKRESSIADNEVDGIHQTSNNSNSKEAWQTIADGLQNNTDYHLIDNSDIKPDPTSGLLKRLEDIGQGLGRLAGELKQCIEDVKLLSTKQVERLEHEQTSALLAASVESEQVSLHNVEEAESKKCANCNREASAECSLCRQTPYCSIYCQKKDWGAHQIECLRASRIELPPIHPDQQHQSIMLIVESQHQ